MSAKKASPSPSRKPASSPARKTSANGQAAAAPAKRVPAPSARQLSNDEIGAVAGEVWGALSNGDGETLAALKKSVGAPPDLVAAAIGWLAREGKLEFTTSSRTQKIALRQ